MMHILEYILRSICSRSLNNQWIFLGKVYSCIAGEVFHMMLQLMQGLEHELEVTRQLHGVCSKYERQIEV